MQHAPRDESLYDALDWLRHHAQTKDARTNAAWRAVQRFVWRLPPPDKRDQHQETLLKTFTRVATFGGHTDAEAGAWLRRIHTHHGIDAARKTARDPVAKGLDGATSDDEEPRVEKLAHPDIAPDESALQALKEALFSVLERKLESEESAARRALHRAHAHAAYLRLVCDLDADAVLRELNAPVQPDKTLLYKWIERGRDVLLQTIDYWRTLPDFDPELEDACTTLTDILTARRKDAGKARPTTTRKATP